MKVKSINYLSGLNSEFIRIISNDGEIVYINIDSIVSITIKTNSDVFIRCSDDELYSLQNVDKETLNDMLEFGEGGSWDPELEEV